MKKIVAILSHFSMILLLSLAVAAGQTKNKYSESALASAKITDAKYEKEIKALLPDSLYVLGKFLVLETPGNMLSVCSANNLKSYSLHPKHNWILIWTNKDTYDEVVVLEYIRRPYGFPLRGGTNVKSVKWEGDNIKITYKNGKSELKTPRGDSVK